MNPESDTPTLPGVYRDLPFEKYAAIPAVNAGRLCAILKSAAHYQDALLTPDEEEEKENKEKFAVGSLAHSMVLEGKDLRHMYAIKPAGMSFVTKEGKAWRDAQTLPILKEEDANSIPKMAESLAKDPDSRDILKRCQDRELTVVAEIQGVLVKARFDGMFSDLDELPWIPDLKTSIDPSEESFSKSIYNLNYDFKAEFYRRVYEASFGKRPGFLWIAIEKRSPHCVCCWYPDEKTERSGHRKFERAMNLYLTCTKTGEWPGLSSGIKPIGIPKWADKEL